MKQLTLLTPLFVLLLGTCGRALLAQADIPASHPVDFISKFQDIHVATDGTGIVVGRCGVLRETMTDGQMWETAASPTDADLHSVACPPAGCATALLLTDDGLYRRAGGGAWSLIDADAPADGTLHWLTADIVVHETTGESYRRSTDGGLTWTDIPLPDFQRANLHFLPDNTAHFWVGDALYRSSDLLATFSPVGYNHSASVSKQTWLTIDRGWLFDGDRLFYTTTDGGLTWAALSEESPLNSVNWFEALSPTHLVGAQITTSRLESLDGGLSWTRGPFLSGGNERVNERFHRRGNEFFTVGDASQILYSAAEFDDFIELDPFSRNNRITSLAATSRTDVYAIIGRELWASDDGISFGLREVFGGNIIDLKALDDGRLLLLLYGSTLISEDGGWSFTDWVAEGLLPNNRYPTAFGQKPNGDYYLMGDDHGLLSTDDGASWTIFAHNNGEPYRGLAWPSDDVGYAFAANEHLVKTTDGGQTWTPLTMPYRNITGIWFTDEMNGWVSNASARYVTQDGGETWTAVGATGGYNYQRHPTDGSLLVAHYLSGNNGEILRSTDDGQTWRGLNFNCYAYRAGAVSPDGKYFWTGGDGGFIVRHDLEALIEQANGLFGGRAVPQVAITASPNPTGGQVRVSLPAATTDGTLQVFDLSGRELRRMVVARGLEQVDVDLAGEPAGVYVVRWSGGGVAGRVKVVKR